MSTEKARSVADARGFWRMLLAIVLPLPWLAKGLQYVVQESQPDVPSAMRYFTTHHAYEWLRWADATFVILVVPSLVGLSYLARRGAPRLATAAALMTGTGFLAATGLILGGGDPITWVAAQGDYDPAVVSGFAADLESQPTVGFGLFAFIIGLVIGSIVLGVALWKSAAVPRWSAIAVAVGGATHPFLQFNHVVVGIGLWVLAIGCLAASRRLVAMSDDDFDLPPLAGADPTAAQASTRPSPAVSTPE